MKRLVGLAVPVVLVLVALGAARAAAAPRANEATSVVLKILVDKNGWHRVTASTLANAGFVPTIANNVQLKTGGQDVAIKYSGADLEFFGQALDTNSSDTRVYWLSEGSSAGVRVQQLNAPGPTGAPSGTFEATLISRDRESYASAITNGEPNNIFGFYAVRSSVPVTRTLNLSNADVSQAATLKVDMYGYLGSSHSIAVSVNGTPVGNVIGSGEAPMSATLAVPPGTLVNGSNSILMTTAGSDAVLTDSYTLKYRHFFLADNNDLAGSRRVDVVDATYAGPPRHSGPLEGFPATPGTPLTVGGFTGNDVLVADISADPTKVRELRPAVAGTGPYTMGLTPPTGATRLYAYTGANVIVVPQARVIPDVPSNLRATTNQADLIVLSHANFRTAVQPLVNFRRTPAEGLAVLEFDVQDVYDEFGSSFGSKDPFAIREFLQYAKNNWANPKPKYVLLVGDASIDPRNFVGYGYGDYIPTLWADTIFLPEAPSDDKLADFNGDARPELAVGRLPVESAPQTTALVNKIINYANAAVQPKRALLVSDNYDRNDYVFTSFSDDLQTTSLIPNGVSVTRVDRPANATTASDTATRDQVIAQANTGPTIVNWFGHGTAGGWAGSPPLLHSANVPSLTNTSLSLYLMMTCQNAYFVSPDLHSLGEALLRTNQHGAVAVWGSSGDTVPTDQVKSAKLATQELFRAGSSRRLGDAVLVAKNHPTVTDPDVLHSWTLLGDPTTRLMYSGPTLTTVRSFTAARLARGAELRWRTATEANVLGFNVYRAAGAKKVKLNRALIAAKHSGKARGAAYRLRDMGARHRARYTYRLEVVSLSGARSWAGKSVLRASR